jgi:hypothetical protein
MSRRVALGYTEIGVRPHWREAMINKPSMVVAIVAVLSLAGCVAYPPAPVAAPQLTPQEHFDRTLEAAAGAISDEGMMVTSQDRGTGTIRGVWAGFTVTAKVDRRTDGSIRVKFDTPGTSFREQKLVDRVTISYNRRMAADGLGPLLPVTSYWPA